MNLSNLIRLGVLPGLGAWLGCNAIIGLELGEPEDVVAVGTGGASASSSSGGGSDGGGEGGGCANDNGAVLDDGQDCTIDACVAGTPSHTPLAEGVPCDNGTKLCNTTGQCVACSGSHGCSPGDICFEETACVSCMDGDMNGGESDTDCGGPDCAGCADGRACALDGDCASGRCDAGLCASCTDGTQNGGETAVDCGGPDCSRCNGEACGISAECQSAFCADGVCCATQCGGTCVSCNLPGRVGACSDVPEGSDDDSSLCNGQTTCDGDAACVFDGGNGHFGDSCITNADCFNNACNQSNMQCALQSGDPCDIGDQCKYGLCLGNVCG